FSSIRRHTRFSRDWSSDVCSSDLVDAKYQDALSRLDAALTRLQADEVVIAQKAAQVLDQLPAQLATALAGEASSVRNAVIEAARSEERRVGKEGWSRGWADGESSE